MSTMTPVKQAILDYLEAHPHADNEEVAAYVRKAIPGAVTTGSSVSSMKSRIRREEPELLAGVGKSSSQSGGQGFTLPEALPDHDPGETIEQAKDRIAVRYDALDRMADRLVSGMVPSLIVSGPPGLGKSFTIRRALKERFPDGPEGSVAASKAFGAQSVTEPSEADQESPEVDDEASYDPDVHADGDGQLKYDVVSGSISAVGLYQALWYTRNGGILVLDDCDDVFRDETALNLLKAALDSSPVRTISWRKEAKWLEDYGIADRFAFKGHVVFLTNIDFEVVIASGKRDAEHYKALIDRSMYLCLTLRSRRDFLIRIRQVSEGPEGMLATQFGLTAEQAEAILDYVAEHQTRFYNLSLRLVGQIALCMRADPERWELDVQATKMRTL